MAPPESPVPAPRGITDTPACAAAWMMALASCALVGKRHGQRLDLVRRRIRGVKLARQIVKGDLAIRRVQRGQLLSGCHTWPAQKLSA